MQEHGMKERDMLASVIKVFFLIAIGVALGYWWAMSVFK